MQLAYVHVDAFTRAPFGGNAAAVVPLEDWLPDELLHAIAAELHLPMTAFVCDDRIRWLSAAGEAELCGHATLAAAHVLLAERGTSALELASSRGPLAVRRDGELLVLDFPARPPGPCADAALVEQLSRALGRPPREVLAARDLVAVYDDADAIRALAPDFALLAAIDVHGFIVTAPGEGDVDFVSRFFTAQHGPYEDPVTGSAHCTLIPLWAERLGVRELRARQLSRRGGELACAWRGDRVDIGGHAVTVACGSLHLPGAGLASAGEGG